MPQDTGEQRTPAPALWTQTPYLSRDIPYIGEPEAGRSAPYSPRRETEFYSFRFRLNVTMPGILVFRFLDLFQIQLKIMTRRTGICRDGKAGRGHDVVRVAHSLEMGAIFLQRKGANIGLHDRLFRTFGTDLDVGHLELVLRIGADYT